MVEIREVLRAWLEGGRAANGGGAVITAVRPERPNGHGAAWESLLACEDQIRGWVSGKALEDSTSGTAAKIGPGR